MRTHTPGQEAQGARLPQRKGPFRAGKEGENLVWCLTRAAERGQGWALRRAWQEGERREGGRVEAEGSLAGWEVL